MRRIFALLLLLLVLTGCETSGNAELTDPGWEAYQQQEQQSQEETTQPEETVDYPAAFSLAYHRDHTLDPITCSEGVQQDVAALLFEPLFQLNGSFEPEPALCTGYAWDETGLVCTLTVRQGVLFSDGTTLTASDVAATLRRAAASERYGYRLRQVASITYSNAAGEVVLTLSSPNQGLIALLDIPVVKSGTENQPVPTGTGPYLFVTGSEGDYLQANGDWWRGETLPVSTIPLVHAKDLDTAVHLFSTRQIELLTVDPTGDHTAAAGQVQETDRPTTLMQFIGFNTAEGRLFSSAEARSAFSGGIQREMLADAFLSGHARAAQFPLSPVSPLYPEDLEESYSYDATIAALTAAGQDTGVTRTLTMLVSEEDSFRVSCAQYISENLSLLDWEITVVALPWEEYLAALEAGEFDLYCGEVKLTADWDLRDLIGTGGSMNYGGYSDPVTDALLLAFASASDRAAGARQLCAHLQDTVPIAPVCFRDYTVLTHTGVVEDMASTPGSTFYALENWTIHLEP